MRNILLLCSWCLAGIAPIAAQTIYFSKHFDPLPNSAPVGFKVATLPHGYAFTTLQGPPDNPNGSMLMITDKQGNLIHQKQMLPGTNAINGLVFHPADSSFYIWGNYYLGNLDYTPYMLKTNFWGDTIWVHEYNLPFYDFCRNALELPDGGFIMVSTTRSQPTAVGYFRIDAEGNLLWAKTFTNEFLGYDTYGLLLSNDSTITIGYNALKAYLDTLVPPYDAYGLLDIDLNGTIKRDTYFLTPFHGSNSTWTGWLTQAGEGKMAFVNRTPTLDPNGTQWINLADSNFNLLWQEHASTVGFPSYIPSITTNKKGNIVGCGILAETNLWPWIFEITPQGELLWERIAHPPITGEMFNPGSSFEFVRPTDDGGYILTGSFLTYPANKYEAWLIKLDSLGCAEPGCQDWNYLTTGAAANPSVPNDAPDLTLTPNPADGLVRTTLVQGEGYIRIINVRGVLLRNIIVSGEEVVFSTTDLPNGLYVVQHTNAREQIISIKKLLVHHP